MGTTIKPIVYIAKEKKGFINTLRSEIKAQLGQNAEYILDYPVIYFHVWQSAADKRENRFSIYVGESTDIIERTREHFREAAKPKSKRDQGNWQYHMMEDKDDQGNVVEPTLYVFGHKFFQRSLTTDLENKFIGYCDAMETARSYNGRGNPQGKYNGNDVFDNIASMIWKRLRKEEPKLFLSETRIVKSALYRASPNHKLTDDQKNARDQIIDRVIDAVDNKRNGQLILVEGEAGTGKTVLTTTTFVDLLDNKSIKGLDCYLLVNHDEQKELFSTMAEQIGLARDYGREIVSKPTHFIQNPHNLKRPADVVFVDEAHLLWTRNTLGYPGPGNNQLDDILQNSRVTVIMFDEYQILRVDQFWEMAFLNTIRNTAIQQGNCIQLTNQLRMNCSNATMTWVDDLTKNLVVNDLYLNNSGKDSEEYEVKVFDTPQKLHNAIKIKAKSKGASLSRLIASYDWEYKSGPPNPPAITWDVKIPKNNPNWTLPWNKQLWKNLSSKEKRQYKNLPWSEQPQTIDEVGSTFTIQGFDLQYAGVILGPSIKFDKTIKRIVFDGNEKEYSGMTNRRTMASGLKQSVVDVLAQHEFRVLMTRATKGLYIYACDDDLRDELKAHVHK